MMLRYEWRMGANDPNEITSWNKTDGNDLREQDTKNLGLTTFAAQTEAYFRAIAGEFTVRILDEKNEPAWQGNTRDGFAFLFKPARGRRFRR